jgi:hypothetical protein
MLTGDAKRRYQKEYMRKRRAAAAKEPRPSAASCLPQPKKLPGQV